MTDAQTENEPAGMRLSERELRREHGEGIPGPDVGRSGRDDKTVGRGKQHAGLREWLPAHVFANPYRP